MIKLVGLSESVSGAISGSGTLNAERFTTLTFRASKTILNGELNCQYPTLEYDQLLELRKVRLELTLADSGYEGGLSNYTDIIHMAGVEYPPVPKEPFSTLSLHNKTLHIYASLEKERFESVRQFTTDVLKIASAKLWFTLHGYMTHGGIYKSSSLGMLPEIRSRFLNGELPVVVQAHPIVGFDAPEYQKWSQVADSKF